MKRQFLFLFLFQMMAFFLAAQQDYTVYFDGHAETFEPNFETMALEKPSVEEMLEGGYFMRYIQFENIPNAKQRAVFEKKGLRFLEYVHFGAYLVAVPSDFDLSELQNESARSIQKIQQGWKISAKLGNTPFDDWALEGDKLKITVKFYAIADLEKAATELQSLGFELKAIGRQGNWVETVAEESEFDILTALPYVQHIELVSPPSVPEDLRGRALHRSNMINSDAPMGKKYDGTGINILVRDDGMVGPHIDFQGRLTDLAMDNSDVEHADGVAGIFAGAGNVDLKNKGMATGAHMFNIDYVNHFEDITLPLHLNEDVRVTNSSYSDGCNQGYTNATRTVDRQIFENPTLLHVFSAGNSGTLNCGYGAGNLWGNITGGHKQAKNCIATANLNQTFDLETSSSRGPAHDGRIKPDIAANGFGHVSTDPNNSYSTFGGTSAAAPGIAGISAQLMHAYNELTGEDAPAALIKGILLNSANDMGNLGPDFQYGWGHVNAHRALGILENNHYWRDTLDDGGQWTHTISVAAGQTEAKFMIYWSDPIAGVGTQRALVNDLDLMVISPSGDTLLPWLLDPTPNPVTLNMPASTGKDDLNNVEQVAVFTPEAGDYTILVHGYEVPMGPQEFYLLYDLYSPKPTLTFPNGGEGFTQNESVRIHWDAEHSTENAILDFSKDGGASWQNITTVPASDRYYDWSAPNSVESNMLVRVTVGAASDTSDFPFTIARLPVVVILEKVCPDSMQLRLVQAIDTLPYDVYFLGDKYMEIKTQATMANNRLMVAIEDPGPDMWYAVGPRVRSDMPGPRTRAYFRPGGLVDCPQQFDVTATNLIQPAVQEFNACSAITQDVEITVTNEGTDALTEIFVSYQLGDFPIVTEMLGDLGVNGSMNYTFATPITMDTTATLPFKAWVNVAGDVYGANDTLRSVWKISTNVASNLQEDFESLPAGFPPTGWRVENGDNGITWDEIEVIGSDGSTTTAAYMEFFNYSGFGTNGAEDALYVLPIDLDNFSDPALEFDVAYARRLIPFREDALRVEAYPACDFNADPILLYHKEYTNLVTVPNNAALEWQPATAADWRKELVSLKQLSGAVALRFVGINDLGNNLYIDNVNIGNTQIAPTVADFSLNADTLCKGEDVIVTNASLGGALTYTWYFGTGANPTKSYGEGPHTVNYQSGFGNKTITLVVNGSGGLDTMMRTVHIINTPNANFTTDIVGSTVTFTNTSLFADNYLWDFGDGTTSTEENPTHTYANVQDYTVTLTAYNQCGDNVRSQTFATVGIQELPDSYKIRLSPNPNQGNFTVFLQSPNSEEVHVRLFDLTGQLVQEKKVQTASQIEQALDFGSAALADGIYTLQISSEAGEKSFKVVVTK